MGTSLRDQIANHKSELTVRIVVAAKVDDTSTLLSLSDELRHTASLLSRIDDLAVEARSLLSAAPSSSRAVVETDELSKPVAGRAHGVQIRSGFLGRAATAGVRLRPHHGAVYTSPSGRRIGIAVATERKPNRWFLGLGENEFDAAVLLCAQTSGKVIDVCLPASFIASHLQHFSRSGGQIKFNVARRDTGLFLKVPNRTPERIEQFVGGIGQLDT